MTTLLPTLALAFVIVLIAIACLAIGWLTTGKSKIRAGACGRDPTKQQSEKEGCSTEVSCSLCKKPEDKTS
jgi:hypothetical protein